MAAEFDNRLKDVIWQRLPDFGPLVHLDPAEPVEALRTNLPITLDADFVLGVGQPRRAAIDISFQVSWDADTLVRVFAYNALLYRHLNVPVHSVILQLRSRRNDLRLQDGIRYSVFPELGEMYFRPEVINLWEQPLEPMLTGGLGLLPLAPLCRMPEGMTREQALPEILRINERLIAEAPPELNDTLWNSTYTLTGVYLDRQDVLPLFDRYRIMRESMTYQATLEEGRVEGRVEGYALGEANGRLDERRQALLLLGKVRLGEPDKLLVDAILGIDDLERLQRMRDASIDAVSWNQIIETN